jgi:hypothetical protein
MRVTTLAQRRLINTGNYENTAFDVAAELAPGEDPLAAGRELGELLARLIRAERERRFPDDQERAYHIWTEEDQRDQA